MSSPRHLAHASLFFCGCASLVFGCGSSDSNGAPVLDPLSDRSVFIDTEFTLELKASDPDNDPISFSFTSDIKNIGTRADLRAAGNTAVFRWTPIASDLGLHSFDFTATDGHGVATETVNIKVEAGAEGSGPIFRQPLGTGTTLDVTKQKCLDLNIVLEDPDSTSVQIAQEEPSIPGATLHAESGLSATWSWCPSKEQLATGDRFNLRLSADDASNPKAYKAYLIVLRRSIKPGCPGSAPTITHTPQDQNTIVNLSVFADVADDKGIKYEPLLYWSTTPPSDPPDLAQMQQVTMVLLDGDMKTGSWGADVPNPVASLGTGSTAQAYYVIVAQDADDPAGGCNHLTQAPETGAYSMKVTNPGGQGGLGLCEPCTSDAQCGGASDNCLFMGSAGNTYCFKTCTSDTDCGDPLYYCSLSEFVSVDGAKSRQCIPSALKCDAGTATNCTDDGMEPNDTLDDARLIYPGLTEGLQDGLKSCPSPTSGANEDWYPIDIYGDTQLTVTMEGGAGTDLDLELVDNNGVVLAQSDTLTSNETVSACVTLGAYFVHVYSWETGENGYSLTVGTEAKTCSTATTCDDDPSEPDDNASQARSVDLGVGTYTSNTSAICPGNEDWFALPLFANETVYATAAFNQANAKEDLDILFYNGSTLLTRCTEADLTSCDPTNGQSGSSNENFRWEVSTAGTYYLVVRGWDGSQNLYDLCIGLNPSSCPLLPKQ